jgi:hypothetical protein
MAKTTQKIPTSAQRAKKMGYEKVTVKHSLSEKKKWVLLKQGRKWDFVRAASAKATGPHTVCYYDPNTGFYTKCHTVDA